jgi:hypothetical protein
MTSSYVMHYDSAVLCALALTLIFTFFFCSILSFLFTCSYLFLFELFSIIVYPTNVIDRFLFTALSSS